jgi:hypothetical protein
MTAARVGRRKVLRTAVAGGAAVALGALAGAVGLVRSRGYELPPGTALVALAPWQYLVVRAAARRICAADAPGVVSADEADVAGFVDAYVARMPRRLRRDFLRFLGVVEQLAPAPLGLGSRFTRLAADDQDRVLRSLEAHASGLLRGGFDGLRALVFMGYYRDPRTWSVLGYDGPRVAGPGP